MLARCKKFIGRIRSSKLHPCTQVAAEKEEIKLRGVDGRIRPPSRIRAASAEESHVRHGGDHSEGLLWSVARPPPLATKERKHYESSGVGDPKVIECSSDPTWA
jgi:hypothetical protein